METIELSRMERERESPVISSAVHNADFYNVRERSDLWAMRPSAAQKTWGRKKILARGNSFIYLKSIFHNFYGVEVIALGW